MIGGEVIAAVRPLTGHRSGYEFRTQNFTKWVFVSSSLLKVTHSPALLAL